MALAYESGPSTAGEAQEAPTDPLAVEQKHLSDFEPFPETSASDADRPVDEVYGGEDYGAVGQ